MRILWIGVDDAAANSGVEIVDRNLIASLRTLGATIETVSPQPVSPLARFGNYLIGRPHYRASYASEANARHLCDRAAAHDVAICSWEPFDLLGARLPIPTVPILHNITSQSLGAAYPGNPIAALLAARAGTWERTMYWDAGPFEAICALSRDDARRLGEYRASRVLCIPPGMPVPVPLSSDAKFSPEIVISGTYGWNAKRRDAIRFAREYASVAHPLPICADDLPAEAHDLLKPAPLATTSDSIRIGLITDRFAAGFKLKSTFYIASNCVVLSYADIMPDFRALPDSQFFIRRIGHAREIRAHVDEIGRVPAAELAERMQAFKHACSTIFSWQRGAAKLLSTLEDCRRPF